MHLMAKMNLVPSPYFRYNKTDKDKETFFKKLLLKRGWARIVLK